jgi:hypothetical protein
MTRITRIGSEIRSRTSEYRVKRFGARRLDVAFFVPADHRPLPASVKRRENLEGGYRVYLSAGRTSTTMTLFTASSSQYVIA